MSDELGRQDIENIIRLLKTALYHESRKSEAVEEAEKRFLDRLDTEDDDVLRWEGEGGPAR